MIRQYLDGELLNNIQKTIHAAESHLSKIQKADGSWVGEVELNPGPTAQVIMLFAAIGQEFPGELIEPAKTYIQNQQNSNGGWSAHFGEPSDISVSLESYVGLRLLGVNAFDERIVRARNFILKSGNLTKANSWTQLYFGVLGIVNWQLVQRGPVEFVLIPPWAPFNLRSMAYWVKVITLPMLLVGSIGPYKAITLAKELQTELEIDKIDRLTPATGIMQSALNGIMKALANFKMPLSRKKAIQKALNEIDAFTEEHGDFGGNSCTAINALVALNQLGLNNDLRFKNGLQALLGYGLHRNGQWRVQTCQSHVWDTGFATYSLKNSTDTNAQKSIQAAHSWLWDRQITHVIGDWAQNVSAKPASWCFGNRHDHFPVTDCTALALMALSVDNKNSNKNQKIKNSIDWLLAMQHSTGGWSAYEKYRGNRIIEKFFQFKDIPNALGDIPKADVSSKVVEALCLFRNDYPEIEAALVKARQFLLSSRDPHGLWMGNYGVNFLYGTSFAAAALRAIDQNPSPEWATKAESFFLESQRKDGSWGESAATYHQKACKGQGAETGSPVQTAWAIRGLLACYDGISSPIKESIEKACRYLVKTQSSAGDWQEDRFLGTVFPGMVYFRYELYGTYFPLIALKESLTPSY